MPRTTRSSDVSQRGDHPDAPAGTGLGARLRPLLWLAAATTIIGSLVLLAVFGWYAVHLDFDEISLPTVTSAASPRPPGADGRVRLAELPSHVPEAVIAIEDRRFRHHLGLDPVGTGRAALANIRAGEIVEGGSTITQQLAKNLFLEPHQTLGRKIKEMILALWLERNLTKDQILEAYLNKVYFGAGAWGIEAAAHTYYDLPASRLSVAQAATLAGVLIAPSALAPDEHPDLAAARAQLVLHAMVEEGYISQPRADVASADLRQAGTK